MKRSELIRLIKENLQGYSKYSPGGKTKGGTTEDFRNILTKMAKETPEEDSEGETKKVSKGKKPIYEAKEKEYRVEFWYRYGKSGDEKEMGDVKVKANSEEEAIEKVKSGEVKLDYGQSLPRGAKSFTAKEI